MHSCDSLYMHLLMLLILYTPLHFHPKAKLFTLILQCKREYWKCSAIQVSWSLQAYYRIQQQDLICVYKQK